MKILARHRWVSDALITESIDEKDGRIRRYTATICGWKNWKIYQGRVSDEIVKRIIETVKQIRDAIRKDEEDNTDLNEALFSKRGYFIKS